MGDSNSFSSTFPDTPIQASQFPSVYTNYINGTGNIDSNALISLINGLSNTVVQLQSYQSNLITNTPEYNNTYASQMFLSNISSTSVQTSTLQLKLDIVNQNIENTHSKMSGGLSDIIFYTYTSATILFGVLSTHPLLLCKSCCSIKDFKLYLSSLFSSYKFLKNFRV